MLWFKHDSTANQDAKLKKLKIRYGMEGYGLYWYLVELIVSDIDEGNLTFSLEHDSELISHDTGINQHQVEEMMRYMVELNLFEVNSGLITCMKLLKRLDLSMTSNAKMRGLISKAKANNHDAVMTQSCVSHDSVMQEEKRREEKRIEKSKYPDFVISDNEKKLFDYRKEIKKPVKTKAGLTGLKNSIIQTAEAWSVDIDTVMDYMMQEEWQSIKPDYSNPFSNQQKATTHQTAYKEKPLNLRGSGAKAAGMIQ